MRALIALIILLGITLFGEAAGGVARRTVWYWKARSAGQRMQLDVRLDNKAIFTTTFSIAQSRRSTIPKSSHAKRTRFSFMPDRSIVWSGYRDEDVVSPAKQRIGCDI